MATPDMDVIRDIPGYKVILKAIIKSQIQQLVEQLATHTDEESVILTASVSDGTLSHLGSDSGKGFLEEQEDVKSQFLGFCLKRHHKQKQAEKEKERLQALAAQTHIPGQMDMGPVHRRPLRMPYQGGPRQPFSPQGFVVRSPGLRHEPYHIPKNIRKPPSTIESSANASSFGLMSQNPQADNANFTVVKSEPMDETSGINSDTVNKDDENTNSSNPNESAEDKSGDDASQVDPEAVKVEAISESEFELEITGVEPGVSSHSMPPDNWGQNVSPAMSYDPSIGATGSSADMSSQGYSMNGAAMFAISQSEALSHLELKNVHICQHCRRSFKHACRLKQHILRVHMGLKPWTCEVCGKKFSLKGNLKQHLVLHTMNM